jgi:hypothetical protein
MLLLAIALLWAVMSAPGVTISSFVAGGTVGPHGRRFLMTKILKKGSPCSVPDYRHIKNLKDLVLPPVRSLAKKDPILPASAHQPRPNDEPAAQTKSPVIPSEINESEHAEPENIYPERLTERQIKKIFGKKLNERAAEINDFLKRVLNDRGISYTKLGDNYEKLIKELRKPEEDLKNSRNKISELNEKLEAAKKEICDLKSKHEKEISDLNSNHEKEISDLKSESHRDSQELRAALKASEIRVSLISGNYEKEIDARIDVETQCRIITSHIASKLGKAQLSHQEKYKECPCKGLLFTCSRCGGSGVLA